MGGDFLSFDEALGELQMATHELRSLVAQGEIRAFRDEDVLRFRRTDVLDLKKTRDVEPEGLTITPQAVGDETDILAEPEVVEEPALGPKVGTAKPPTEETELLTGIGSVGSTDFLGLDESTAGLDGGGDTAQTVVPTIEISDEDMIDDTAQTVIPAISGDEETDVFRGDATAAAPGAPSLLAEEDEATEMATQEISPDEVAGAVTESLSIPGVDTAPADGGPLRFRDGETATAIADGTADDLGITTDDIASGVTTGMTAPRRSQQYLAETAAPVISPVFVVLAAVTLAILLFAVPIFYGLATDTAPKFAPYDSLIRTLYEKTAK